MNNPCKSILPPGIIANSCQNQNSQNSRNIALFLKNVRIKNSYNSRILQWVEQIVVNMVEHICRSEHTNRQTLFRIHVYIFIWFRLYFSWLISISVYLFIWISVLYTQRISIYFVMIEAYTLNNLFKQQYRTNN